MFETIKKWNRKWNEWNNRRTAIFMDEVHRLDKAMKAPYSATGTVVGLYAFLVFAMTLAGIGAIQKWGATPFSPESLFAGGISFAFLALAWDYIWIWYMRHRYAASLPYW